MRSENPLSSRKPLVPLYLLYFIMILLFIGGIFGVLKRTVPGCENLSINILLGLKGNDINTPLIVIYSIGLAVLEIISAICLLISLIIKKKIGLYLAVMTIGISAVGSIAAILFGDISAIFSLVIRIIALIILFSPRIKMIFIT